MVTATQPQLTKNGIDLNAIKLPKLQVLDPFDIEPLEGQIRKQFFGIAELAASIKVAGQATPIIVRELPADSKYPYGLIDGERRLRACCETKRAIIACIHDGLMDLQDVHALSVAANFGRQKHDCMEIAKAISRFKENGKKIKDIADIFGKSSVWVWQHHNLLKLHPTIQNWLVPGALPMRKSNRGDDTPKTEAENARVSLGSEKVRPRMNFGLALQLLNLPQGKQLEVAKRIVGQNMSLAEARRMILKSVRSLPGMQSRVRPDEWRRAILSIASRTASIIGTYNDMNGLEFNRLIDSLPKNDLRELYNSLEKAGDEIMQLTGAVKRKVDQRK